MYLHVHLIVNTQRFCFIADVATLANFFLLFTETSVIVAVSKHMKTYMIWYTQVYFCATVNFKFIPIEAKLFIMQVGHQ